MREMKDSGIHTVGKVPVHWKQKRLKFLCTIQTGNEDTQNANPDGEYPFYVRSPIIERCDRYTFDGEGILVAGDGAGAGRIFHHALGKYAVHQRVYRLANLGFNSKFIHYYLSSLFPYEMDKGSAQSTVPSMRLPMLQNFPLLLPNENEAKQIINYLDKNCAEIDSIIENIQHQIELLQEYKQSVITEAVTKGLDKNVAMKDSGIEWIGDIPHTWNVYRLKYIVKSSLQYGANESGLEYTDELPRYVRITDIDNNGRLKDTDKQSLDLHTAKPYLLDSNDILLARSGATVGKAFLYHESDGPCAFAGYLIRAKCKTELLSKLVYYYTMSYSYNDWKNSIFSQATIPNIGADKYSNLRIPISPNEKEQRKIIDYLDQKCAEIDAVLTDKQKQLDTLTEYKKSLIYEYVTGKKEVPADA